ncbi:hypothetical protein [Agromyces subbeticus]|uniref:hypothetical protein n=1 Tax=Agromyces subbeticus TaxID=293890 RepID=UPI0003B7ACF2|nr:hypothetical protein [Agromyces subbeticus]
MPGQTPIDVAAELYTLLPDEFTAARNNRAKSIRPDDRELADAVQVLRRPSPAAWLVNQLVRRRGEQVDSIIELGERLRDAQDDLDAETLAQFARQRRQLVAALARDAGELAEELGNSVRSPVLDEVAQTMQAAMSDAAAADAVRSARLVRALEAVGREVDLDGAVAGGPAAPARPRGSSRSRGGAEQERAGSAKHDDSTKHDEAAKQAEQARAAEARERAEREAREAEERAVEAERVLDELDSRIATLRRLVGERTQERDELEERLRRVEGELADAEHELRPLGREHDRATRSAREARAAADESHAALD